MIGEVRRRAARPITNLVPYMAGMAEGDLADIVAAVMDATDAAQKPAAGPSTPRQHRDRTVAEAIANSTPDHQDDQPRPEHDHDTVPGTVIRIDTGARECPHGHPGGASPRP